MRLSRLALAIAAAAVALVTLTIARVIEARILRASTRAPIWIAGIAGGLVLLLADRFGLMASPYEDSPLDLNRRDGVDDERGEPERSGHKKTH